MRTVLCLDLGTSAAKAALTGTDGSTLASAVSGYPTSTTPDGGAQQDPGDWIRAARSTIAELLAAADPQDLAALSLTGQMQDHILDIPDGAAAPAVLYSDTRARAEAQQLHEEIPALADGATWPQITANEQGATSCAAMHRRRSRTESATLAASDGLLFGPAGYLARALGAERWCDPTTAGATGLLDARRRAWSAPVLAAAGIDPAAMPRLTGDVGQQVTTIGASPMTLGLPAGLPVILAPGDAAAATLGIVGLSGGDDYASLGTSGWIARVEDQDVSLAGDVGASHRLALAPSWADAPPRLLRISALLAAGAAASWAREAFLDGASPQRADELVERRHRERGRGPSGLLALPSILGERFPLRAPQLRGAILGMDAETRGIDCYIAVLEGVAHALAHAGGDGGPLPVVGGGAASAPWMRILADVTGREVRTVDDADASLVGCAIAAADALGLDHGILPLAHRAGVRSTAPDLAAVRGHAQMRAAHRALYDAALAVQDLMPARA